MLFVLALGKRGSRRTINTAIVKTPSKIAVRPMLLEAASPSILQFRGSEARPKCDSVYQQVPSDPLLPINSLSIGIGIVAVARVSFCFY